MVNCLSRPDRNLLAEVTLKARDRAEQAVRAALENLAVHERDYRPHLSVEQRELRKRLRARARALSDERDERTGVQEIARLVEHGAYEHWHRLLFTRFLAENHLLHTDPENGTVPVTLAQCDELAPELGARDGFDLACRFASRTLPGVFRRDDPVLELRLAPNDEVALRQLLASLPAEVFRADDALGWTYQYWQAKRKDEVNDSGKKIGADELPAVTQLFTEDYMVEFLLHNTLGAWWAGKQAPISASSEEEARRAVALTAKDELPAITWTYLRFVQDETTKTWTPAAGTFEGWPKTAREIRFLDPCMGSGHFPVFALAILARLRMEEERLTAAQAIYATLQDNIYGLELDLRCTQIGAFNLALTAWKVGGWQDLPQLHVACSGLAPEAKLADWVKLAGKDERRRQGMEQLYKLFEQAPVLGSLINPRLSGGDLIQASFEELAPLLEQALADEKTDETTHELAITAQGIAKAAQILSSQFTLVATNVPYLGRGNQDDILKDYCERLHSEAKADLATCFVERCLGLCSSAGTSALVTPQNWLFLGTYKRLRYTLLREVEWNTVARLGAGAFETIGGEVVNVTLLVYTIRNPSPDNSFLGIDVSAEMGTSQKAYALVSTSAAQVHQIRQLDNPDASVTTEDQVDSARVGQYASSFHGVTTTDYPRFGRFYWESHKWLSDWVFQQGTLQPGKPFSGRESVLHWEKGKGGIRQLQESGAPVVITGLEAWGKSGVVINQMNELTAGLYTGEPFDTNVAILIPSRKEILPALWAFCSSKDFNTTVRRFNQKMVVEYVYYPKLPFDLAHWQEVAAEHYSEGLPKPHSDDPTQWIFSGHPKGAEEPLQVAVSRLLGYRWPRQTGSSFPDCPTVAPDGLDPYADDDGIVCLPALNREQPAAARLRILLAEALGKQWRERDLLATIGSTKATLEEWLRDEFFQQHCNLFHQRPFIWHVWDGRKDGFHALVNYHRLDNATLQKLTYSYLGDWIRQQEQDAKVNKAGAAERLGAAKELQAELAHILEGEPPYDIFVRWKALKEQPLGWQPDLNDGVRLNIRPFMQAKDLGKKGAGLLRAKPNIKWEKDRGSEPQRRKGDYPWFWSEKEPPQNYAGGKEFKGQRWNNVHCSLAVRRASRKQVA